jgi:hypothetical protein
MSHFYGTVGGQSSGEATRRGSKNSGLRVAAASWQGAVYVYLFHDEGTGKDCYRVELGPWKGNGRSSTQILASGEID